jgi:CHAT domain-containing protein
VYGSLARAEHEAGLLGDAFLTSERLRAGRMLTMLTRGRLQTRVFRDAELMEREQDLRRHISELRGQLATETPLVERVRGPAHSAPPSALRRLLESAAVEHAELMSEMRAMQPAFAELVRGDLATRLDVAARLDEDDVFLEYLVTDSTTLVFVVTSDTIATFDLDIARRPLASLIDFARSAMDRPAAHTDRRLWISPLRQLYQSLLAPIESAGFLNGKRTLRIVPHAELHYLPFQALVGGASETFLIERFEVSYAPSGSVWTRLVDRRRAPTAAGVLALAPLPERLSATPAEIAGIESSFGRQATALLGPAASESRVRDAAASYDILHLATLGVLNKANPLFSYVELSGDSVHDGRLEVHEVFGMDLAARLVVLSACETALASGFRADVPAGDDWIGLVRAFLFAGASNVVASLWRVEDRATAELMRLFYRSLKAGAGPSRALANAQRAMLDRRSTADPFFWAGFTVIGSD